MFDFLKKTASPNFSSDKPIFTGKDIIEAYSKGRKEATMGHSIRNKIIEKTQEFYLRGQLSVISDLEYVIKTEFADNKNLAALSESLKILKKSVSEHSPINISLNLKCCPSCDGESMLSIDGGIQCATCHFPQYF